MKAILCRPIIGSYFTITLHGTGAVVLFSFKHVNSRLRFDQVKLWVSPNLNNLFIFKVNTIGPGSSSNFILTCRDANFPDAEIVRSKKRGGHGPRAGPGRVQEQRHLGLPREICHCDCISDQIYRKYCTKTKLCLIKITGCYLVFT